MNLPRLYASHWAVYCLAIKLLHAPESSDDVNFAESLINFYCQTISQIYDRSLEYYSLHAHLHLPAQVRLHGGLSFCSVRCFNFCISSQFLLCFLGFYVRIMHSLCQKKSARNKTAG